MRFACQSCGKAYNLPDEKIADKSNVKLKCRVCGAIVEVKRQGEVVAQVLAEIEGKRGRVSEAPAPLTSMSPDDTDDATHAIAVGDQILSEGGSADDAASALLGHVKSALSQQRGLPPLPPPAPTGFGPTPVPPPLAPPEAPLARPELPRAEPPPPTFARQEPPLAPPLPNSVLSSSVGSPPPPPLPPMGAVEPVHNGSNGMVPRFGDVMPLPDDPVPALPIPPVAPVAAMALPTSYDTGALPGVTAVEVPHSAPPSDDTTKKMLAALVTGILIGFIIARLFF
jgi:hypothetical protein